MAFYRPYIQSEWEESIRNHKYSGADFSIIYVNIMSPLCNKLVNFFPEWVAPNLITAIGLFFVILSNVLVILLSGLGNEKVPGYISITAGILYYTYHILDNIDGKQARRTNNSTPLGMLVDHGCDSMTTFMLCIILCSSMRYESGFWYGLLWVFIAIPFFMCTWEQNITGFLHLPMINGVSEGSFTGLVVLLITGIVGSDFWVIEVITISGRVFLVNEILLLGLSIFSILTIGFSIKNVYTKNKSEAYKSIGDFIVIIFLFFSFFLVLLCNPESDLIQKKFKLVIYLYGFMFAKLLIHLMVAHIAHADYEQFRFSILGTSTTLIIISLYNIFSNKENQILIDYFIYYFLLQSFLCWAHLAWKVSGEICDIVGIYRFSVERREIRKEKDRREYNNILMSTSNKEYLNVNSQNENNISDDSNIK